MTKGALVFRFFYYNVYLFLLFMFQLALLFHDQIKQYIAAGLW